MKGGNSFKQDGGGRPQQEKCGRDVHTTRQVSLMAQIKQQIGEKYWKNFHYASTLPYSKVQKK